MRTLRIVIAAGLIAVVAACGSDSKEAVTTEPVADSTVTTDSTPAAETPPETEPVATEPAGTEPVEPSDSVPSTDDATSVEDDQAFEDAFAEVLFPEDQVDDVPVCKAFAAFFNRFAQVTFSGAYAGFDEEGNATAGDITAEKLELVLFLGIDDEVAELESELPGAILDSFGPTFERIKTIKRLMTDAGFSETELKAIEAEVASGGNGPLASAPDDDPRLVAAANALIAESGTFLESLDQLDTLDAAGEAEGDAWLQGACPELFVIFDNQ